MIFHGSKQHESPEVAFFRSDAITSHCGGLKELDSLSFKKELKILKMKNYRKVYNLGIT
jgi:hypothetical protein